MLNESKNTREHNESSEFLLFSLCPQFDISYTVSVFRLINIK